MIMIELIDHDPDYDHGDSNQFENEALILYFSARMCCSLSMPLFKIYCEDSALVIFVSNWKYAIQRSKAQKW